MDWNWSVIPATLFWDLNTIAVDSSLLPWEVLQLPMISSEKMLVSDCSENRFIIPEWFQIQLMQPEIFKLSTRIHNPVASWQWALYWVLEVGWGNALLIRPLHNEAHSWYMELNERLTFGKYFFIVLKIKLIFEEIPNFEFHLSLDQCQHCFRADANYLRNKVKQVENIFLTPTQPNIIISDNNNQPNSKHKHEILTWDLARAWLMMN